MKKDKSFKKGQSGTTIGYKNMGWFSINWGKYKEIIKKVEEFRERDGIIRNESF